MLIAYTPGGAAGVGVLVGVGVASAVGEMKGVTVGNSITFGNGVAVAVGNGTSPCADMSQATAKTTASATVASRGWCFEFFVMLSPSLKNV